MPQLCRLALCLGFCVLLLPGCERASPAERPNRTETTVAAQPRAVATSPPARPDSDAQSPQASAEVAPQDVIPLHLEVTALEVLYQLRINRAQLEQLGRLAARTAGPAPAARAVVVSHAFAATLHKLHDALLNNDDDAIARLSAELEELRGKESPDLSDPEITEEARKSVPEIFRGLSARQVAAYVTDYADDFPDPREKLADAINDVRRLPGREWEEVRDEVTAQVGWLVAGLDRGAGQRVAGRAAELLNKVKGLKDDEFQRQRPQLEKDADVLTAGVDPSDVVRHFVERSLSELLSNPRLADAVRARLAQGD